MLAKEAARRPVRTNVPVSSKGYCPTWTVIPNWKLELVIKRFQDVPEEEQRRTAAEKTASELLSNVQAILAGHAITTDSLNIATWKVTWRLAEAAGSLHSMGIGFEARQSGDLFLSQAYQLFSESDQKLGEGAANLGLALIQERLPMNWQDLGDVGSLAERDRTAIDHVYSLWLVTQGLLSWFSEYLAKRPSSQP